MNLNSPEVGEKIQQVVSVDSLIREHRMLDEKVTELSERSFLTPEDNLEMARLKKEKLKVKDKISEMSDQSKSA